jgi:hypothetical protein
MQRKTEHHAAALQRKTEHHAAATPGIVYEGSNGSIR